MTISGCKASNEQTKTVPETKYEHSDWFYLLAVLGLGLLSYIPCLGSYGLLDPTDSFFLESGRELLEKNQFLLPLNNYVPWLDKPILFFWMVAYSFKFFGISTFAGRLPAALSAVATGLILYCGCRPILNRWSAALAALIFMSAPLASIIGHVCLTDMTLCALITGSNLFLFKGLQFQNKQNLLLGYFFLGLALLCKGPIAVILCGLAFLPYLMSISKSKGEFFRNLLDLNPIVGAAIVLLMNLPWYVLATMATNGRFLIDFFITQNFGRMVGAVNHQGPFYFYIPVFFAGFFPWWTFCLSAPGLFKKTIARRFDEPSSFRRLLRLSFFWFITVMALFSAIKTKLPTYILPALPAFAILVAMQLQVSSKLVNLKRFIPSFGLVTVSLIVGLAITPSLKGYVKDIFLQNIWIGAPLVVSLIVGWVGIANGKFKHMIASVLFCSLIACGVLVPRGLQAFYNARQVGFSKLVTRARNDNASISMIFAEEPSVPWITHKPVSRLMNKEDVSTYLKLTAAPHYILVQTANMERLSWFPGKPVLLAEEYKWHLYSVEQ